MARGQKPGFVWHVLFDKLVRILAWKNLTSDRFGTFAAILGVAMGVATVDVVLVLDASTSMEEAAFWTMNPALPAESDTVSIEPIHRGVPVVPEDAHEETHEDYEVMRSAVRLGSLSAFLIGGLIVFFTFAVVVERRRREVALIRSLGATRTQTAAVFAREALILGLIGALIGVLLTIPLAKLAALAGITTTGRARISRLTIPWDEVLLVAFVGVFTALLGVLRPARDIFRLRVAETLLPRFLTTEDEARAARRRTSGTTLVTLPFMALVYGLMRPFFREALPSLTFFVVEAGLFVVAFVATIVAVPELVRLLGGLTMRILPLGPNAPHLITQRRIEHRGQELALSVSGIMLVFALVLALHIATRALGVEIGSWADGALDPYAFIYQVDPGGSAKPIVDKLPKDVVYAELTTRTPWPSSVHAVDAKQLVALVRATGDQDALRVAEKLGPGRTIVSKLMARRFKVVVGDGLTLKGRGGERTLTVVGVTDRVGYVPTVGPYRNGKTYALIDAADEDLILPYADPRGTNLALVTLHPEDPNWRSILRGISLPAGLKSDSGRELEILRKRGTAQDFVIFDLMLGLSALLSAVGMANQLILGLHARKRELSLYRALGMTTRQLRRMVLLEGVFVGTLGGLLAVLLGMPLGYAAVGALRTISAFDLTYVLPVNYVLATFFGALGVAVLSTLYPASRAVQGSSAESIHYE